MQFMPSLLPRTLLFPYLLPLQQEAAIVRQPVLFIWSVRSVWSVSFNWFVWFVWFVWLNQTDQIDQMNHINPGPSRSATLA